MERYDYYGAVKDDIYNAMQKRFSSDDLDYLEGCEDIDDLKEKLYDDFWIDDSVTGNASGSYTFNAWTAEEYICHNLDLLQEALEEFGENVKNIDSAEWCDVTIRCYLLGPCLYEVLQDHEREIIEMIHNANR